MVRRAYAQRSAFEVLLPDGDQLWDPELRGIDVLLEDEEIVNAVEHRPLRFGEKETKESLLDLATKMLAVFCEHFDPRTEVVAVEQPFSVPLIDQETGEVLERDLVGTLDLLERDPEGRRNERGKLPPGTRATGRW